VRWDREHREVAPPLEVQVVGHYLTDELR
jgi:hypothetical protein